MLPPGTAILLILLLTAGSLGQRPQRPPRPPSAISTIQPKANFDAQQVEVVGGRGRNGGWLWVAPAVEDSGGRAGGALGCVKTQKVSLLDGGQLSVKLYARSLPVSDSVLSGFEQRVREAHLTEDQIFYFPKYGFCEAADQFHVLDEVRR
nr:complement component C8 gamma chain [Macaca fascicularis]